MHIKLTLNKLIRKTPLETVTLGGFNLCCIFLALNKYVTKTFAALEGLEKY